MKVRPKRVNQNITGVTENARVVKSDTIKDGINVSDRDAVTRVQESVRQRPASTTGTSTVVTNGAAITTLFTVMLVIRKDLSLLLRLDQVLI